MTSQHPIGSGFGAATTAVIADIDLGGRTAIVTGGYSGLGLKTARLLAQAGAQVIVPVRSMDKARKVLKDATLPNRCLPIWWTVPPVR